MSDLVHLKIWDDPAIHNSQSWYLDVAENGRPAKISDCRDRCHSDRPCSIQWMAGEPLIPSSRLRLSTRFPYVSSPISDWAAIPLSFGNAL